MMILVRASQRAGVAELTYQVGPGEYHVFYCDPASQRCSCARWEPTDCRHLHDTQDAQSSAQAPAAAA